MQRLGKDMNMYLILINYAEEFLGNANYIK
jgi:hypothetical protein